ncbi:hypothetical protein [Burkholderia cepacia]|uniref:hypothetical protein n=1 Tax=Burkholderia cepacia TaxID=292 RepID=UPI003B55E893
MIGKVAWLSVVSLLVAACGDRSGQADTASNAQPASASATQAVTSPREGRDSPVPPRPGQVLEGIYQKDAHGEASMEIANGSQATYWYGHAFDLNGGHYFTGFAYETPNKYAEQENTAEPVHDARVTITEATFEWVTDGGVAGWNLVESERSIGEFGGDEKADTIDETNANGAIRSAHNRAPIRDFSRVRALSSQAANANCRMRAAARILGASGGTAWGLRRSTHDGDSQ